LQQVVVGAEDRQPEVALRVLDGARAGAAVRDRHRARPPGVVPVRAARPEPVRLRVRRHRHEARKTQRYADDEGTDRRREQPHENVADELPASVTVHG
jgi:hypothetical protein